MADYTPIPSADLEVGAKPFARTVQALEENPRAMFEGAAGAPRLMGAALDDSAKGMVLLGTLATTSGSTVTLSSLNLTTYREIRAWVIGVSAGVNVSLRCNGQQIADQLSNASDIWRGVVMIDLTNGLIASNIGVNSGSSDTFAAASGPTNASTSISFSTSAGSFDAGSIVVYGVR
jgi:hypothetical protein